MEKEIYAYFRDSGHNNPDIQEQTNNLVAVDTETEDSEYGQIQESSYLPLSPENEDRCAFQSAEMDPLLSIKMEEKRVDESVK